MNVTSMCDSIAKACSIVRFKKVSFTKLNMFYKNVFHVFNCLFYESGFENGIGYQTFC